MVVIGLLVWLGLSVPVAVMLGRACNVGGRRLPTLEGMDGGDVVYRHADGRLERIRIAAPVKPVA